MLKDNTQMKLSLSPFQGLYDIVVPQNNLLRKIKENIDFSFVNPMLRKQYCEHFGRPAKEPEMMFKLMFLKKIYDLSDERVIRSAQTDMAYKYFLDLEPEAEMINPSLLTKFRKTRITEDILEEMLRETIRQAIEKGLIKSTTIIVDSTHTVANVRPKTATQALRDLSKRLRREIYRELTDLSEKFPDKPDETAELSDEINYTYKLLDSVESGVLGSGNKKLIKLHSQIKELLDTEQIQVIYSENDQDARFGHKTAKSSFFGYKNHLAMSEERIITGIKVTHGGAADSVQLPSLLKESKKNGMPVTAMIGDMAYLSKNNLDICLENEVTLYARTNPKAVAAADGTLDEGFYFNKDAETLQCPAGELAMRFGKRKAKNGNIYIRYIFSKVTCNKCPIRDKCRVGKSNAIERGYSITQASDHNQKRLDFEAGEEFRDRMKIRYRIEEKNGEMKVAYGLGRADSIGLTAMRLQMYFTAFVANVKRIVKLSTPIKA